MATPDCSCDIKSLCLKWECLRVPLLREPRGNHHAWEVPPAKRDPMMKGHRQLNNLEAKAASHVFSTGLSSLPSLAHAWQ